MRGLLAAMALLSALHPAAAFAASGKALGVTPAATIDDQSSSRTLVVGADVFIGDRVVTDTRGLVQIRFSDSTRLVVGPNSALVIEDYLLRQDGSGGKFVIDALAGTFRFVTGGAPKNLYSIKTPTGSVGVRGTAFDINVKYDHSSLLLYHGSVVMCNNAGDCVTIDDTCDIGMFDLAQAKLLFNAFELRGNERTSMRGMFPWSVSESPLLGAFRIANARQCLNGAATTSTPPSLGPGSGEQPPAPPPVTRPNRN